MSETNVDGGGAPRIPSGAPGAPQGLEGPAGRECSSGGLLSPSPSPSKPVVKKAKNASGSATATSTATAMSPPSQGSQEICSPWHPPTVPSPSMSTVSQAPSSAWSSAPSFSSTIGLDRAAMVYGSGGPANALFPPGSASEMGSQNSDTFPHINISQPSPGTAGIFIGTAALVPVDLNVSAEMGSPMSVAQGSSQISSIPMDMSLSQVSSSEPNNATEILPDEDDSNDLSEVFAPPVTISVQSQRNVALLSHHWELQTRNGMQNVSVAGANSYHGYGVQGLDTLANCLPSLDDDRP